VKVRSYGRYNINGFLFCSTQFEALVATTNTSNEGNRYRRYVSYDVNQAERAVEGIKLLERWMDDFAHVQTAMQASIDSQTSIMHDLIGHIVINPDA
jgi:hypothetical protein